ncbi:MAG: allantoinase AllB [Ornithinimicrobium sp.]
MSEHDVVFRAQRVLTPQGESALSIGVREGRIRTIGAYDAEVTGDRVIELGEDVVLMPGVVDTHVHVNDPGRTDWEGFTSATKAAAAGGVTTLIDMPLNSIPPTVTEQALALKRETAAPQAWIDVGFWGGAVPGNVPDLAPLHEAGVFGFKCFLLHSGVDEFPHLNAEELVRAMREIASFGGLLIVHAEDAHVIEGAPQSQFPSSHYDDFLASRPADAENRAIAQVIDGATETGCRVHILHVSSAGALPQIRAAKDHGVAITAETCPHYLTLRSEDIPDGATQFKCCPPIREGANQDELWAGLAAGTIDMIVSDHSPSTIDLKHLDTGDFGVAWGGVASVQLSLAAIWTAARARGFSLGQVSHWMSQATAAQAQLSHKGTIVEGADADLIAFAPDETFVVDPAQLQHKNPITAYAGKELHGVVHGTWVRGRRVDIHGDPHGALLTRPTAPPIMSSTTRPTARPAARSTP